MHLFLHMPYAASYSPSVNINPSQHSTYPEANFIVRMPNQNMYAYYCRYVGYVVAWQNEQEKADKIKYIKSARIICTIRTVFIFFSYCGFEIIVGTRHHIPFSLILSRNFDSVDLSLQISQITRYIANKELHWICARVAGLFTSILFGIPGEFSINK